MSDSEEEAMCRKCRLRKEQKLATQLKWFKFALPHRGEAVPLLMWNDGDQQYVLKGSTFGTSWTGDDTTQWFGHFEVARVMGGFDIIIFEVSKNDGRRTYQRLSRTLGPATMKVGFGNSLPMSSNKQSSDGVDVTLHETDATFGDRNGEEIRVGVEICISLSPLRKWKELMTTGKEVNGQEILM